MAMKPEEIYRHLKALAEKLQIAVLEQNLRKTPGLKVKSGLCLVKGEARLIMDKHLSVSDKNEILAACLVQKPLEHVYVVPAVRDFLKKWTVGYQQGEEAQDGAADPD